MERDPSTTSLLMVCLVGLMGVLLLAGCERGESSSRGGLKPRASARGAAGLQRERSQLGSSAAHGSSKPVATAREKDDAGPLDGGSDEPRDAGDEEGPLLAPAKTQDELLALITLPAVEPAAEAKRDAFLRRTIKPGKPAFMNQGNPELGHHGIAKTRCLRGLKGMVLQTEEQRQICGGHPLMVPVYHDGEMTSAKACIDVFEFPNKPCELPFVWASPTQAKAVCRAQGKRLCRQEEWILGCGGDPQGKERSRYAYGDKLDLEICNTNKAVAKLTKGPCDPDTARTTWDTCWTNTEPAGAFPRCRSRLGVFDLHGNVAEIMTRKEPYERKTYSQLKGSAFFYVDVHRKDGAKRTKNTYADHCAHNPRWHVQEMNQAWHVNYHLGFRCCLTVR